MALTDNLVQTSRPKPVVSIADAMALIIGIVIGAGIFRTPGLVASNASSESVVLLAWAVGGVISIIGALVYGELATTYPHAGGDYHYLSRAFGRSVAFLFAWARMSIIQTGSIALLAFVVGDYAREILSLGEYSSPIYAAITVVLLTGLNILGVRLGTAFQKVLTILEVGGVLLLIIAGMSVAPADPAATAVPAATTSSLGLMMVFVLLTYGGWNEAAYVSAELKDVQRNMVRALVFSLLAVSALYIVVNWAYLHALGLSGVAGAEQVAAVVMERAFGGPAAKIMSLLVAISAITSANASIFTGARTTYACGSDFSMFGFLGRWSGKTGTPVNALIVQGAVALALVVLGTWTRQGFSTIVDYTAPVFWLFFLLTGIALFELRRREPNIPRPFRVPLYPLSPLVFCATSAYLLYSSLMYTGRGALVGMAVLALGAVLLLFKKSDPLDDREDSSR